MDELENILKTEENIEKKVIETPNPALEEQKKQEDEIIKKQQQLDNLNKAIEESNRLLKATREAKKQAGLTEEVQKIDFEDPGAKAWDKHIRDINDPLRQEIEKEKEEIRSFALRDFLSDKPALSSDPEKLKELMTVYEQIKTASERTTQGVMLDLNKAFAAVYHDELISSARESRVSRAKGNILFSDPMVSRGSTAYFEDKTATPERTLTEEDKAILARWNISPQEWAEDKKKYQ